MDDELRTLRRRVGGLAGPERRDVDAGGRAQVVVTTSVGSYPSGMMVTFMVQSATVSGDETEGADVTITPYGDPFPAMNLGSANPPEGTPLLCALCDDGWTFRFDG